MKRKIVLTGLIMAVLAVSGIFAADQPAAKVLKAGTYSAKVVSIPCAACPPEIIKTLKAQAGIDEISVDEKASTVQFTVKPGAQVQLSGLQKALKAASDQMGMGADYELRQLKRVKLVS